MTTPGEQPQPRADGAGLVPLGEATRTWFAISLQTFGGPAGQIAVMQHALVDEKRWIGQKRFLHALSFCTLLPGQRPSSWRSTSDGFSMVCAVD